MLRFLKGRKPQSLTVDRQQFNSTDAEILVASSSHPLFSKMRKELHCELVTNMLIGEISKDYHRGWLDCMSFVDGMIERAVHRDRANKDKQSDTGEVTSMQMDND